MSNKESLATRFIAPFSLNGNGTHEPTTSPQEASILEALSDFTFISKYARYAPRRGRRETWEETVARVEAMHLRRYASLPAEDLAAIREAFRLVYDKTVLPSMRSMQFGGPAIEANNTRMFNCVHPNTSFITAEGVKSFNDFADGDETVVLTHTGQWKPAKVRCYGEDDLYPITVKRGNAIQVIWATKDHCWVLKDGSRTTSLAVGNYLLPPKDIFSNFDYDNAEPDEKIYWAYGFVYGDGTIVNSGSRRHSMVRLCDQKRRFKYRFEELGFRTSSPPSFEGDFIAYTGRYLKTTPNPQKEEPRLIRAFVRGYLDADGERNPNYIQGYTANKFLTIQASDEEQIAFIRNCFPIAGIFVVSEEDLTGRETNFGIRPPTIKFRLNNYPGQGNHPFGVTAIGNPVREKVWCLEVEDDHSFVLPNGIVTGNCAGLHIHSPRAFAEFMFLSLCGTGVGIGLRKKFLNRLPDLVDASDKTGTVLLYQIEDNIEGWADSVEALLSCYFRANPYSGRRIVFDYSKIRPAGSPLKTSGGLAPGHESLKSAHYKIKKLLDTIIEVRHQKRLKSIDVYDILMHCADAVVSGGIRRSATIALFEPDDEEMMKAKTGKWLEKNPQRARSNNSVLLLRNELTFEHFKAVIEGAREFGEPGFVLVDHEDALTNPCSEVGLLPVTPDGVCGVQFCNLTTQNGAKIHSLEDWKRAISAATLIGTLQAGYTDFRYLSVASREITRREALLGVSLTGWMENPKVLLDPENQSIVAEVARAVNETWAAKLGIKRAARITLIKPEGTASCILGTASGIHPHHARRYFRRVQCNRLDPVYKFFAEANPHMTERSVWSSNGTDDVLAFPLTVSSEAILKSDLSAIDHLAIIRSTQHHYVRAGANDNRRCTHNVSCTVLVKEEEWQAVTEYLYRHRGDFCAVSLIPASGDKLYQQAPMEALASPEDEERFNALVSGYVPLDYANLQEGHDATQPLGEIACGGGACEL